MHTRLVTTIRILAFSIAGALVIGLAQAAVQPSMLPAAHAVDGVTLAPSTLLHGNGASLAWSRYTSPIGTPFTAYEVHRSATAGFSPGPQTLLTRIGDINTTTFTDDSAAGSGTYSYRIVAGQASDEIRVTLPAAGTSTLAVQPDVATYLTHTAAATACGDDANMGAEDRIHLGNDPAGFTSRALLRFDLSAIPARARVVSAQLVLSYSANVTADTGVRLHRVLQPWTEGAGRGTCTGQTAGASWAETQPGVSWQQPGAAFDPTAAVSLPATARSTAGADTFGLTGLVQQWANGTPNHGVLLKQADESSFVSPGSRMAYYSDEATDPAKRPALAVAWEDPAKVAAATVRLTSPAAASTVRGQVTVTALASAPRGVRDVTFLVDGVARATDTTAPFTFDWDTTAFAAGNHTIAATAASRAGATATASHAVTVNNSPAPTGVAVTAPAAGATVAGTVTINASATDDGPMARVDFMLDGTKIGSDTTEPYSLAWNTAQADGSVADGAHELKVAATDSGGQTTISAGRTVTVANAANTMYKAEFFLNELGSSNHTAFVPPTVLEDNAYAPGVDTSTSTRRLPSAPCEGSCIPSPCAINGAGGGPGVACEPPPPPPISPNAFQLDVDITNRSTVDWRGNYLQLWYRWYTETGVVLYEGPGSDWFPTVVKPNQMKTVPITVEPPPLPVGVDRSKLWLRFDIYDFSATSTVKWFASKGNKAPDNPVIVNRDLSFNLGFERFWQYEQLETGAGSTAYANVTNGNLLWRWSPWATPGRGIASLLDLTYNSLEEHSQSSAGNNFSLNLSGLVRFGSMLDVHPNQADLSTGKSNKYVTFVDGDGTTHRFNGTTNADGTTTWTEPAGVNLYLRSTGSADPRRYWALTRPDRLTYFFDAEGYPRLVEDTNGNLLEFELVDTPPGDDPGGPKKRVTKIWDPARRAYSIDYWTKDEVKPARVRGKIQRITDHSGSALDFEYYDDGNLRKLIQRGGMSPEGIPTPDRSFVFTYWDSPGNLPAIPLPANRVDPNPSTNNQSTKIYSIRDPRGTESAFTYWGSQPDPKNRWKVRSWADRLAKTTNFTYNYVSRVTTVDQPMARDTDYGYDTLGRVTRIVDPLERPTTLAWSADNKVTQVTHPNLRTDRYSYDHNGYLTSHTNENNETSRLTYEYRRLDTRDTAGHWGLLRTRERPEGVASATVGDHMWLFTPDADGNITRIEDPDGFATTYTYNLRGSPDAGTVLTQRRHLGGTTSYEYHPSGQPSKITDPVGNMTTIGYDADSRAIFVQDGEHQDEPTTSTDVRSFRQFFDFDEFGRLARQSQPKSTDHDRGQLIWTANTYDPNDNPATTTVPAHAGAEGPPATAPVTATQFDLMDRPTLQTGPDTSADPAGERTAWTYDDAGRQATETAPKGVRSAALAGDYQAVTSYDELDRITRVAAYGVSPADVRYSHQCYDINGDVVSSTAPRARLATINCAASSIPFTTRMTYDRAHRMQSRTDPDGHQQRAAYNLNGETTRTEQDIEPTRVQRSELFYNERGLVIRNEETFTAGGRKLTSVYQYDGNGNRTAVISPRSFDADAGAGLYTHFTTRHEYDLADRMTTTTLPSDTRDNGERQYIYTVYDKNNRPAWRSLPTTAATAGAVSGSAKTTMTYFDPGWVRRLGKTVNAELLFDYDAMGMQTLRVPDKPGQPGVPDDENKITWTYYVDGQRQTMTQKDTTRWHYDEHNNVDYMFDPIGVHGADDKAIEAEVSYTGFDEVAKVRHHKDQATTWKFARFTYNEHGLAIERLENGEENTDGTQTKAPKTLRLTYDNADWVREQLDLGTDGTCKDDTRTVTVYWGTGWERTRDQWRGATGCTADPATWRKRQSTSWTHFDNGKLRALTTRNGSGEVTESHDVGYFENGRYEDGHRTTDTFTLKRAADKAGATSCVGASTCVADWDYDARGKVLRHQKREGKVVTYELDRPAQLIGDTTIRAGNVTKETDNSQATTTITYRKYEANQLRETTVESAGTQVVTKTWHDPLGDTDCVTTQSGTRDHCNGPKDHADPHVITEYNYDPLHRLLSQASYGPTGGRTTPTDSSNHVYDALDRPLEETEDHQGATNDRKTVFSHLGLSNLVTEEKQSGGGDPRTKSYAYNAVGQRIAMTDQATGSDNSTQNSYTYGNDVHGSVSQLLDESGGVKASYGYDAYGKQESSDGDPQGLSSGDLNDLKPLNPYRYSGQRLDSGSATSRDDGSADQEATGVDMGARRYDLNAGRFLQQDMFQSAFADLALSVDPMSQNMYALAGGNPVSNVEFDGHHPRRENGGRGTTRGGRSTRSSSNESTSESSGGDADSGARRGARRATYGPARGGSERRDGLDKAKSALSEIGGTAGKIGNAAELGRIGVETATGELSGKFREAAKRPSSLRGGLSSARSKAYDWAAKKTDQMGGKLGRDLGKVSKAAGSVAKLAGTAGSVIEGVDGARQQWREDEDRKDLTGVEKGLRAGVRGVTEGGGSAVGGTVGGAVGGAVGLAAGSAVCGPACGAVGGVVGGAIGSEVGSRVGAAAGDVAGDVGIEAVEAGGDAVEAGGDVVEAVGDVF